MHAPLYFLGFVESLQFYLKSSQHTVEFYIYLIFDSKHPSSFKFLTKPLIVDLYTYEYTGQLNYLLNMKASTQ